jgi:hypothetical protein
MLLLGSFLIWIYGCDGESKRQLGVLQHLASDIPAYQDFRQVRSFETNKWGMAMIVNCYRSSAGVEDVTKFYSQNMLSRGGWSIIPKEKRMQTIFYPDDLVLRKDDYWLGIKKDEQPYNGCNYVVTYYWNPY